MLVATTILTSNLETERAEILNKWIQIAVETKTALGNLYGFSSIIMALCMPQVSSLSFIKVNFRCSIFYLLNSMNKEYC